MVFKNIQFDFSCTLYTVQYILQQQEIIRNETKIRTGTENV